MTNPVRLGVGSLYLGHYVLADPQPAIPSFGQPILQGQYGGVRLIEQMVGILGRTDEGRQSLVHADGVAADLDQELQRPKLRDRLFEKEVQDADVTVQILDQDTGLRGDVGQGLFHRQEGQERPVDRLKPLAGRVAMLLLDQPPRVAGLSPLNLEGGQDDPKAGDNAHCRGYRAPVSADEFDGDTGHVRTLPAALPYVERLAA